MGVFSALVSDYLECHARLCPNHLPGKFVAKLRVTLKADWYVGQVGQEK